MSERNTIATAWVQLQASAEGIKSDIEKEMGVAGDSSGKSFGSGFTHALGTGFGVAAKIGAAALGSVSAAVAAIGKESLEAYANYEQLVGGVETLFGTQGMNLMEYADSVGKTVGEVRHEYAALEEAQDKVMANAAEAYMTAGLSANDYMETVTSFSAALISSLDGQTDIAADVANQAIIDMSDNANKMGSSMESIQNAYQGFAKQNYTMLDNLKLGYGGTKSEMERLLEDATALSGIDYNIDSYADIIDAIHVIQDDMGITGTTAREASETIQGSLAMTKAAWDNLLTGLEDEDADIDQLVDNLVTSADLALRNLLPRAEQMLGGMITAIDTLLPEVVERIPGIVGDTLPKIVEAGVNILIALIQGISDNDEMLVETAFTIIDTLVQGAAVLLPMIDSTATEIILTLADGMADYIPELIPVVVDIVLTIADHLMENLPWIIEAGMELIVALVEGIMNAMPELIMMAPELIGEFTAANLELLPQLVFLGLSLIMAIVEGLIDAVPSLIEQAPVLIESLADSLEDNSSDIEDAGVQLMAGLWSGIKSSFSDLLTKIPSLATQMVGKFRSSFQINSPSRLMRKDVGYYVGEGAGLGVGDGWEDAMEDVTNRMMSDLDLDVPGPNVSMVAQELASNSPITHGQLADGNMPMNITIPVYVGQKRIETIVLDAQNIANYISGGR